MINLVSRLPICCIAFRLISLSTVTLKMYVCSTEDQFVRFTLIHLWRISPGGLTLIWCDAARLHLNRCKCKVTNLRDKSNIFHISYCYECSHLVVEFFRQKFNHFCRFYILICVGNSFVMKCTLTNTEQRCQQLWEIIVCQLALLCFGIRA